MTYYLCEAKIVYRSGESITRRVWIEANSENEAIEIAEQTPFESCYESPYWPWQILDVRYSYQRGSITNNQIRGIES